MQPGEGAFDDPPVAAKTGAVRGLAAGDLGLDPEMTQRAAVLVVVVSTVGTDALGPLPRSADLTAPRRDRLDKRDQLGDVVAVAARDRPSER